MARSVAGVWSRALNCLVLLLWRIATMGMVLMYVRHSMTFTSKDSYAIKRDFRYKFAMEDDELFIEDESSYGSENTYGDVVQENDDVRLRSVSVESIST